MSKVVASGAAITTFLYILIGVFGYATFANNLG
jgi:amino acid permease